MTDQSCRGCWYVLRHLALRTRAADCWEAWQRYDSTGDPAAFEAAIAAAPPALVLEGRRLVVAMGFAEEGGSR